MGDQVEHQAVVEKGLKMKIKRKNPNPSTAITLPVKIPIDNKFVSPVVAECEKSEIKKSKSEDGLNSDSEDGERSASSSSSSIEDKIAKKSNKSTTLTLGNKANVTPKSNSVNKCNKSTPNGSGQLIIDDDAKRKNKKGKDEGDSDAMVGEEETTEDGEDKLSTGLSISNANIADDPYKFENEDLVKTTTPKKRGKMERTQQTEGNIKKLTHSCNEAFLNASPSNVSCNAATETNSIAVTTDMDLLGPCEPGTSVILEGIVWSESNNGILVVNVTWRGKTYVGTLMDATKHHWASPRYRDESPLLDAKTKRNGQSMEPVPEGRRLRKCRRNNISTNNPSNNLALATSNGCNINSTSRTQPQMRHSPLSIQTSTDNRRRPRPSECESPAPAPKKILREPIVAMVPADQIVTNTETMFECRLVPDCGKKFKHAAGLRYHQSHAHKKVLQAAEFADLKAVEEKSKKIPFTPVITKISPFEEDGIGALMDDMVQSSPIKNGVKIPSESIKLNNIEDANAELVAAVIDESLNENRRSMFSSLDNSTLDHTPKFSTIIDYNQPPSLKTSIDSFLSTSVTLPEDDETDKYTAPKLFSEHYSSIDGQARHRSLELSSIIPSEVAASLAKVLPPAPVGSSYTILPARGDMVSRGEDDKSPAYSDISDSNEGDAAKLTSSNGKTSRPPSVLAKSHLLQLQDQCMKIDRAASPFGSQSLSSTSPGIHGNHSVPSRPTSKDAPRLIKEEPGLVRPSRTESSSSLNRVVTPDDRKNKFIPPTSELSPSWDKYRSGAVTGATGVQASLANRMYDIDPYHIQLMASSPVYRNQVEQWYMDQHCYRQMFRGPDGVASEMKPVDMSAKSSSERISTSMQSFDTNKVKQRSQLKSNTDSKAINEISSRSDKNREDKLRNHLGRQREELISRRDEGPLPIKEEVVRDESCHKSSSSDRHKDIKTEQMRGGYDDHNTSRASPSSTKLYPSPTTTSFSSGYLPSHVKSLMTSLPYDFSSTIYRIPNAPHFLDPTRPPSRYDANKYVEKSAEAAILTSKDSVKETNKPHLEEFRKGTPPLDKNMGVPVASIGSGMIPGHNSPLTLRHLHTHHHTHVVGAHYPIYPPYSGLVPPVTPLVSPVPVLPSTYLPK